jgi:hypothetical protein
VPFTALALALAFLASALPSAAAAPNVTPDYAGVWKGLYDWQTLITGILALIAAFGTIWATIVAANREIAAAQEQTRVAQEQIAVTLRVERQRIARESYAFFAMLEAAMGAVVEDIEAAGEIFAAETQRIGESTRAYEARQRVKKTAFAELRSACLRFGGQLTTPFLCLDKAIDDFAAEWITVPSAGEPLRKGTNAGLGIQLQTLKLQADALRKQAHEGMTRCTAVLADMKGSDFL